VASVRIAVTVYVATRQAVVVISVKNAVGAKMVYPPVQMVRADAARRPEPMASLATESNVKTATSAQHVVHADVAKTAYAPVKSAKTAVNVINAENRVSAKSARKQQAVKVNDAPDAASVQSAKNAIVKTAIKTTASAKNVRTARSAAYVRIVTVTRAVRVSPTVRASNAINVTSAQCAVNADAAIRTPVPEAVSVPVKNANVAENVIHAENASTATKPDVTARNVRIAVSAENPDVVISVLVTSLNAERVNAETAKNVSAAATAGAVINLPTRVIREDPNAPA